MRVENEGAVHPTADNDNEQCDCAPGCCTADDQVEFDQVLQFVSGIMGDAIADAEQAAAIERADKSEAVAQLGRIIEGLTILTAIHADLVKDVVEG
jgi:hypothetical protein